MTFRDMSDSTYLSQNMSANPLLHPTRYSDLCPPPRAGELKGIESNRHAASWIL
jgi:hypothetical protein